MSNDNDIPVLRDAVARRPTSQLSPEQIDDVCDRLSAEASVLLDKMLAEALREAEENIRTMMNDRLSAEFPSLIEKTLQEALGKARDQ
jgi:hypothetical protein